MEGAGTLDAPGQVRGLTASEDRFSRARRHEEGGLLYLYGQAEPAMAEDWDQYLVKKAEELGDILDAYREASREAGQKCQEALALDGYEPPEKEELDKILLGEVSVGLKGLTEKGKKTDAHAPGHGQ